MIYHFHQLDNIPYLPLMSFIKKGYLCVDLFFVLSGFVMAMNYGSGFLKPYSWRNHEEFLLRRVGRVYPLYIAITLAVSIYSLVVYGGFEHVHRPGVHLFHPVEAHVVNILMIQAWGFGECIGGPTWSISTEWMAYILFPFLVVWALSSSRVLAANLLLIACAALCHVAFTPEAQQSVRNGQMDVWHGLDSLLLLRCLGGFCLGMLAYRIRNMSFSRWIYSDIACLLIIVCLIGLMAANQPDLVIYPFLPLLVLSLYGNRGRAAWLFSGRAVYMLGVLSYSIYLVHEQFLVLLTQLQKRLLPYMPALSANTLAAVITYSLILVTANVSYRVIENPGRQWFKRFARKVHDGQN